MFQQHVLILKPSNLPEVVAGARAPSLPIWLLYAIWLFTPNCVKLRRMLRAPYGVWLCPYIQGTSLVLCPTFESTAPYNRLDDNVRCLRNFHHTSSSSHVYIVWYGIPLICTVFNVFLSSVVSCSRFIALVRETNMMLIIIVVFLLSIFNNVHVVFCGWTNTNSTVGKAACAIRTLKVPLIRLLYCSCLLFLFSFLLVDHHYAHHWFPGGWGICCRTAPFAGHFGPCHCQSICIIAVRFVFGVLFI